MKLNPWSIAIALVLFVVCSVGVWHYLPEQIGEAPPWGIDRVTIDGHLYYKTPQGALVHSEACPCKNPTNR